MEIINAFITTARSRLSNPLMGSFIISWLVWNWKIVLVAVGSSQTNLEKITAINKTYSDPWILLWCPLFTALALSILLPPFNLAMEWLVFNRVEKRRLDNRKAVAEKKATLEKIHTNHMEYIDLKKPMTGGGMTCAGWQKTLRIWKLNMTC